MLVNIPQPPPPLSNTFLIFYRSIHFVNVYFNLFRSKWNWYKGTIDYVRIELKKDVQVLPSWPSVHLDSF